MPERFRDPALYETPRSDGVTQAEKNKETANYGISLREQKKTTIPDVMSSGPSSVNMKRVDDSCTGDNQDNAYENLKEASCHAHAGDVAQRQKSATGT
jgi:hypothetical protein